MIYIVLAVLGLMMGSFVNALVWRVHELKTRKRLSDKQKSALSMTHGRSMCSICGHQLSWNDLIPVFSWVSLSGKCRYCGKPIPDSPLVELGLAAAFVLSYSVWPSMNTRGLFDLVVWLVVLVCLAALLVYDLKWMILPNKIVHPLFWIVLLATIVDVTFFGGGKELFWGSVYGFLVGGGIFYLLFQVSKGKWIGGGDVRLGAVLGLILASPTKALLTIFVASTLGTVFVLPLLGFKKLNLSARVPFGPFLIVGGVIAKLAGSAILHWYTKTFMIV
jgi:prepilin signal peptidase PulO-like enzyme (type II secretory pathway)